MSDYLLEQQKKFEYFAENYRKEANASLKTIILTSLFIAIIYLFRFASVFYLRALFTISIVFGIDQLLIDFRHLVKWTKVKFQIVEDICSGEINESNLSQKTDEKQKTLPSESMILFVKFQILTLIIGMILCFVF